MHVKSDANKQTNKYYKKKPYKQHKKHPQTKQKTPLKNAFFLFFFFGVATNSRRKQWLGYLFLSKHLTHFIYGYKVSAITREVTCCHHMGYSSLLHHVTERIVHTTAFLIPVLERWLDREIAHWVHHEG